MRTSFHHQSEAQPPNGPLTAATSPDTPSTCPATQSGLCGLCTAVCQRGRQRCGPPSSPVPHKELFCDVHHIASATVTLISYSSHARGRSPMARHLSVGGRI